MQLGRLAALARDLGRDVGSSAAKWGIGRRSLYNYVVACNAYSDHGLSAKDIREIGPTKLAALTGNLKVLPGTRKVRELAKRTTVRRFVAAVNGYEAPDVVTLTVEAGSKKTLMQHLKSLGYSSNGRDVRANSRAIRLLIKSSKLGLEQLNKDA